MKALGYLNAWITGMLFALGLGLAGMTRPERIQGFLDITGNWDPTLLFVMAGAVGITFILFPLVLRRPKPLLDEHFHLPPRRAVNGQLILGAILFGVGWGLSGYCPGPAIVSLVKLHPGTLVFTFFMLFGLGIGWKMPE